MNGCRDGEDVRQNILMFKRRELTHLKHQSVKPNL